MLISGQSLGGVHLGDTPADGRTIIFTDSRDDAANTAAGVELNHFRDLIRQIVTLELETTILLSLLRNKSWWGTILRRALSERNVHVEQVETNVIKKGKTT